MPRQWTTFFAAADVPGGAILAFIWCLSVSTSFAQGQVTGYEPVTDAELLAPAPGDWINWRRTLDGQGFSPLTDINRETVSDLQLVWSWATPPGTDQVTALLGSTPEAAIARFSDLQRACEAPVRLEDVCVTEGDFDGMVKRVNLERLANDTLDPTRDDLMEILRASH